MTKEEKIDSQKKLGKYYGYPQCCIDQFVKETEKGIMSGKLRNIPSNYTGFIPCDNHIEQIIRGVVKIEDLIQNRECNNKFSKGR